MDIEELKEAVIKLLLTDHDFEMDEASEVVETSATEKPHLWDENVDPKDLAEFLASDDNDD